MKRILFVMLGLMLLGGCDAETDPEYVAEINTWHAERVERLTSDTGWLTLVGLHPLGQGLNTLGSGPDASVKLIDKAPVWLGDIAVDGVTAMFAAAPELDVFELGAEAEGALSHLMLDTDADGAPSVLTTGSFVFHVIERGGVLYLRIKDREAQALRDFTGIERYPVEGRWRVEAHLEGEPDTLEVPDVLGNVTSVPTPGTLVFKAGGRTCRLTPTSISDGRMFLVFGDKTNGPETYPGGRFLVIDEADEDGTVWIDFNRAYNPPCAFTDYATCPLPTPDNKLDMAVTAGEKRRGSGH